ncbi:hypothetical protein VKT23_007986 [Stygiomarasmius scandens]|uniref:Myb-like domain-containing protein n=1 Tax=Marasmiellus scandens TaxID=2682957 RepID=A0ABR1JJK2_9AGAR
MSAVQAPPTGGAWADEEHNHIIEFLSRSIYEGKGRPWKQLVKAMTGKHSLEAWKARYKDYRPYFDSKIDDYMRKFFGKIRRYYTLLSLKALILSKSPIYRTTPTTESTNQWRRFTETDGQTLTAHLAENDLDGSKRQWFRSVYKPLVIVSPGHSADGWQGHYRTYADYFDYQIQQYQKSHGLPITPGQTSLKGVKMPTYASLVPKTMSKRKSSQFSNHNSRSMPYIPRSKRLLARSNQSDTQNEASTDAGLSTRPRLKASTKHRVVRRVYVLVPGRRSNSGSSKSVSRKPGEQSTLTFSKSSEGSQRNLLENTELLDRDFSGEH